MNNVPAELVPSLITDCSGSTLVALALVSKYYHHVATPILYENVSLQSYIPLKAFSDTLVSRRPILCQYPKFLHLSNAYYIGVGYRDPSHQKLKPMIKQLLMHIPNITELHLMLDPLVVGYVLDGSHFPFSFRKLHILPIKDARLIEFLKTRPEIEHLDFTLESRVKDPYTTSEVSGTPSTLEPHILPNLNSVRCNEANIGFLVPNYPITSVYLWTFHSDFKFRKDLAKSSAPLKRLSEHIQLQEHPWDASIFSHCLPSLEFCKNSLSDYSLQVHVSAHQAQRGLAGIRECLSTFPGLKRFSLNLEFGENDLTPDFCAVVPELSQFDVWKKSCPKLEEITVFGITLKK